MLFRYGTHNNGDTGKKAHIYTRDEHGIDPAGVEADALWVIRGLRREGFRAYVVGGAVRDLLVGRTPNDFDVATDAHPPQIKRLFRSARIIGRRFRLVHVYSSREKFVEVTTFRSGSALGTAEHSAHPDMNNRFGTMEEDAERRDFTFNALYYSPIDGQLIDWVGGLPDIRHRRLRTLGRAEASFAEDPVRMIRAVKYASLLDFPVPIAMAGLIRRMRESVLTCSRERVTEEVYKILSCGSAEAILELSHRLRLFEVIFPALAAQLQESRSRFPESPVGRRLEGLDERTREGTALDRAHMFGFLFGELAAARPELLADPDADSLIQGFIRTASAPLFPSKKDLAVAAAGLLKETQLRRRPRHGQPTPARHGPERAAKREGEARTGKTRRRGGRRRRRGGAGGTPAPPL